MIARVWRGWTSVDDADEYVRDAIRAVAGEEETVAVFYAADDRFLVERELHVTHYDVVSAA